MRYLKEYKELDFDDVDFEEESESEYKGRDAWYINFFKEIYNKETIYSIFLTHLLKQRRDVSIEFYDNKSEPFEELIFQNEEFFNDNGVIKDVVFFDDDQYHSELFVLVKTGLRKPTKDEINNKKNLLKEKVNEYLDIDLDNIEIRQNVIIDI